MSDAKGLPPGSQERRELRSLLRSFALICAVIGLGALGFRSLAGPSQGWLDAVYMTVITLTTVGFGETIPISSNPKAQVFTVLLLLFGAGTFVYFFSNVTAFFLEGTLDRWLWRHKVKAQISRLSNHTIICGGGGTGEHVLRELTETKRSFVLIERDTARISALYERFGHEFPVVEGDATEDQILSDAGIERAFGLVASVSSDKDNLVVVFSARALNSKLRIVARAVDERVKDKLQRAGANAVVSPNHIGGLRMASELIRPAAVNFLDRMLRDHEQGIRVEGVKVEEGSRFAGLTVESLRAELPPGALLVAIESGDGRVLFNPASAEKVQVGSSLVLITDADARRAVEERARPAHWV
ncbi:MAG: potassium channel protein [Deltaproteobacteria bacterium]|nr:potassium channel protein [Deltaproteobacteria bacterium]